MPGLLPSTSATHARPEVVAKLGERRLTTRRNVAWVASVSLATLASVPVALVIAMSGVGLPILIVPVILVVIAARINASLFYPEIAVHMPAGTLGPDDEIVVTIGPGRPVFDQLAIKARGAGTDAENETHFDSRVVLLVDSPAPGSEHRVRVGDVVGGLVVRGSNKTYTLRVQGYVRRLPDAVIDVDLVNIG